MKKRFYVINGGLLLLLVASLILNARYIYGNIGKHYQDTEDEASASNHKTAERKTSASKDVTVLWGNLSISWLPETPMEGWFIDHLREKLGIDIFTGGSSWLLRPFSRVRERSGYLLFRQFRGFL